MGSFVEVGYVILCQPIGVKDCIVWGILVSSGDFVKKAVNYYSSVPVTPLDCAGL